MPLNYAKSELSAFSAQSGLESAENVESSRFRNCRLVDEGGHLVTSKKSSREICMLSVLHCTDIYYFFRQIKICTSECNHTSTTIDSPSDLSPFNHFHFSNNSILPLSKICGILWQTPIRTCFCSFICR